MASTDLDILAADDHSQPPLPPVTNVVVPSIASKQMVTVPKHFRLIRIAVKLLMFLLVLSALVASKVSLVTILGHLRSMTNFSLSAESGMSNDGADVEGDIKTAVGLYWQLLLILVIPNLITWVRALFNGVIGKSASQPWPKYEAILMVSRCSILICLYHIATGT